jgi:hypothetical protein
MAAPWNNWYHCMGSTKGAWLLGDPRGWRARHHREHCEGDYKHPPPRETHGALRRRSVALMKRKGTRIVELTWEHRVIVCREMMKKLVDMNTEVIELAVTARHFHMLARLTPLMGSGAQQSPRMAMRGLCDANALQDGRDPLPRHVIGVAKKHAAHVLSEHDASMGGGVFAKRCKCLPIENREHQVEVVRYIFEHVNQGGAVHSILVRDGVIEDVRHQGSTR